MSILKFYTAVSESEDIHFFDIHQNPNDECLVGKHIRPVLEDEFSSLESSFASALESKTLKDIIANIKSKVSEK